MTKELMSEILDLIIDIKDPILEKNTIKYEYQDPYCTPETYIRINDEINVYEFMSLCKEWISKQGKYISTWKDVNDGIWYCDIGNDSYHSYDYCSEYQTNSKLEYEAVFEATIYLMNELNI